MNNQPIAPNPNTVPAPLPAAAAPSPVPTEGTPGDGFSIASFVLGLISVIFLPLGTIPGFLGFVLSLDAKRRGSRHSLLSAGRVLSIIGMVAIPALYLLLIILSLVVSSFLYAFM